MNKILSLFESFRKPDPQGEPIDLTYGKLRVNRTVSHGGPALSFNETSVAGGVDSGLYLHDCTFDDISYEKGEPDKMSISITVEGGVDGSFDSIFGVNLAEGP
jgi:hypothetical protein